MDYRDVGGLLRPFHATIAFDRMDTGMTDEEAAEVSGRTEAACRHLAAGPAFRPGRCPTHRSGRIGPPGQTRPASAVRG